MTDFPKTKNRIPAWKKALFGNLFAFVLLVFLLLLAETVLTLGKVGHESKFYRKTVSPTGQHGYTSNRSFAHPYFSSATIRRPQWFFLDEDKKEDELRIFVLGSSAAMGDPEASFSAARMLQRMFEICYPEKQVIVVNAAMTAINSHTVRRIARDCAKLEPDAFLVYEGNNEIIGPFGPSGVLTAFHQNPFFTDLQIGIRETRFGQLIQSVLHKSDPTNQNNKWGGMEMFLERTLSYDDPRVQTAGRMFERNLEHIIKYGLKAEAVTVLNTVIVNKKDFAPFQSEPPNSQLLSTSDRSKFKDLSQKGDLAMGDNNPQLAIHAYQQAWEIFPRSATLAFRIGRAYLAINNPEKANEYLKAALKLDTLRFRTSDELNALVRKVGESHQPTNDSAVQLIDIDSIFASSSHHQIVGNEWLYEHVHLNPYANYQLARIWFLTLIKRWSQEGLLPTSNETASVTIPDYTAIKDSLALNVYEQGMIAQELLNRFQKAPFTGQIDNGFRIQQWHSKLQQIQKALEQPQVRNQVRVSYQTAIQAFENDPILKRNYGMALCAFEEYTTAIPILESAHQWLVDDVDLIYALTFAYFKEGQLDKATISRQQLIRLEPNFPEIDQLN